MSALLDFRVFGAAFEQTVDELRRESSAYARIGLAAQLARQAYQRLSPEFELLRAGASLGKDLRALAITLQARRRSNLVKLATSVRRGVGTQSAPEPARLADALVALTSYDVYRILVLDLGWSATRYERWLAKEMRLTLLGPDRKRDSTSIPTRSP